MFFEGQGVQLMFSGHQWCSFPLLIHRVSCADGWRKRHVTAHVLLGFRLIQSHDVPNIVSVCHVYMLSVTSAPLPSRGEPSQWMTEAPLIVLQVFGAVNELCL